MVTKISVKNNFENHDGGAKIGRQQVLVFKTNISRAPDKKKVIGTLAAHPQVSQATLDTDDCDRVLRVVAALHPDAVISSVKKMGFTIEELNY